MIRFFVATTVLFLSLSPLSVYAHSWGTSYETQDNGYSIDVGYSSPAPSIGESVIFDFEILRDGNRFRDFTDVWVRIENEKSTVLATGIHNADFGGARLSYTFPTSGEHTINVRYQNNDNSVASASFPITVVGSDSSVGSNDGLGPSHLIGVAIGLIIGFVVTSLFVRK